MADWRRFVAARVVDPVFWRVIKRLPVLAMLARFRDVQWDDAASYERRRDESLGKLLAHAVERVPFYRERAPDLPADAVMKDPLGALASFPVLERADLHEHLQELRVEMGRGAFLNSSGGSTGVPVRFYQDSEYQAASVAASRVQLEWFGVSYGERHLKLWGAPRDLAAGMFLSRRGIAEVLGNRLTLDAFQMSSDERMREYLVRINRFRPVLLEGYADAVYELARFAAGSNVDIAPPKAVVTSATTLLPHMREEVERRFGAPVFDRYGSREVGSIACECDEHEGLHVFGETTVTEIVDARGNPVGEGEEGELLVTNLWNYSMPFIRYRIGDRAVRGGARCSCGRPYPLIESVAGRTSECFLTPGGGVMSTALLIHLIGVVHNVGAIRRFQFVQEAIDEIVVRIVPRPGMEADALAHEEDIARRVREAMGGSSRVRFVIVDDIAPSETGKRPYVVSKLAGVRGTA